MKPRHEGIEGDEFRRGKDATAIEALREWRRIPEHIRKLLLANAFCRNCGTTEFAPGYALRMRHGRVLIEGRCAEWGGGPRSQGFATNIVAVDQLPLGNIALVAPSGASNL